jgi:hypothetical protein
MPAPAERNDGTMGAPYDIPVRSDLSPSSLQLKCPPEVRNSDSANSLLRLYGGPRQEMKFDPTPHASNQFEPPTR